MNALVAFGPLLLYSACAFDRSGALVRRNVTSESQWWGALHRGQVLVLKGDLLARRSTNEAADMATDIPLSQSPDRWITLENVSQRKEWRELIVPAGTRLKCERLFAVRYFPISQYELECVIINGPRTGDRVITSFLTVGAVSKPGSLRINEVWATSE